MSSCSRSLRSASSSSRNVRHDDNERFGDATTYRVAPAVLVPVTETKLKASYGTGFKAPTLNQLFVDFLPTLLRQPEPAAGGEHGLRCRLRTAAVRQSRPLRRDLFQNDITNLISGTGIVSTVPFTVRTTINIGKAETSGVEAFVAVKPIERSGSAATTPIPRRSTRSPSLRAAAAAAAQGERSRRRGLRSIR